MGLPRSWLATAVQERGHSFLRPYFPTRSTAAEFS